MAIKTKWNQKDLDNLIARDTKRFLSEVGEDLQNNMATNAPFDTGLLANSINYHTSDGRKGNFGSGGSGVPSSKDIIEKPSKFNTVRIGSGLIYAASVEKSEKSGGWMSRVWDFFLTSGKIEEIQRRVFKI